jgi:ABC-type nitrate/sulfonate/bicarbonate transport system substrate-binding protein
MLPRLALALGLAQAVAATGWNKSYDHINYGAFTQTATYSIAQELGFFSAYGLNVTYQQVPNSTYAEQQVLSGGYDILTWTIDNAVNFRLNSNVSLTVLGQLDQGPGLALASVANITSVQQLKGKALIVDSAVSGYAYLLQKILSQYGLWLANGDYSFTVSDHQLLLFLYRT